MEGNEYTSSLTANDDFHLTVVLIILVISFLVASVNTLVLLSISRFTKKTYTFSPFISSLCLTEVLQLLGPAVVSASVYFTQGIRGFQELFTLCRVQAWLVIFLRIAAGLSVFLIGLDRTLALVNQKFYQLWWRGRLLVLLVFTVWILSAFLASWPLFGNNSTGPYKDAPHVYCLFVTTSNFAAFFALFHVTLILVSLVFIWNMLSSSRQSLFSAKFSSSTGKVSIEKRRNLVQEQYGRMMSVMAAAVIGMYCICITPLTISVFLGWFSISYPPLYGLVSLQIPMVSGLINPFLYGFMWPPYRRAYIQVLSVPLACCRGCKRQNNARSHDLRAGALSRNPSFWSTSGLPGKDATAAENPLNILLGPSSYNKPLDFKPDELQMFDNEGIETSTIEFDVNSNTYKGQATAISDNVVLENSTQFQSILDLIEEMTAGRTKSSCSTENHTLNRERSKSIDSKTSSAYWSAEKSSTHASEAADMDEVKLSFEAEVMSPIDECKEKGNVKPETTTGCTCLGKSKCYVVEDKKRYLDYLVAKEVQEMANQAEEVVFLDI